MESACLSSLRKCLFRLLLLLSSYLTLPDLARAEGQPVFDVHFAVLTSRQTALKRATPAQMRLEVDILNTYFKGADGSKPVLFQFKDVVYANQLPTNVCPALLALGDKKAEYDYPTLIAAYDACADSRLVDPHAINFYVYDSYTVAGGLDDITSHGIFYSGHPLVLFDWERLNHTTQSPEEHEFGHVFGLGHVCVPGATLSTSTNIMASTDNCNGSGGLRDIGFDAGQLSTIASHAQTMRISTLGRASQSIGTISFSPATVAVGGITTAIATATSGLAVAFGSITPTICSVSSSAVTALAEGICTIVANQAGNTSYAAAAQVTQNITVAISNPNRLINLSTRGQVQTGDNVMIGGFIIGGAMPKKVLVRAVGPSLANYGVSGVLANPMLELHKSSDGSIVASNDDWGSSGNANDITTSTLAPADAKEAAILTTLSPGAYTAIVTGNGGATGVGIIEVYEIDTPTSAFTNISTRGQVLTGDGRMIGGFIVQGDSPQTVLVRAVGPTLANYGVSGTIANPILELYKSSDGSIIASNDDWNSAANAAAVTATGLAPLNALESAILITLEPGAYTAVVSGKNGGTGVGIVEVFSR